MEDDFSHPAISFQQNLGEDPSHQNYRREFMAALKAGDVVAAIVEAEFEESKKYLEVFRGGNSVATLLWKYIQGAEYNRILSLVLGPDDKIYFKADDNIIRVITRDGQLLSSEPNFSNYNIKSSAQGIYLYGPTVDLGEVFPRKVSIITIKSSGEIISSNVLVSKFELIDSFWGKDNSLYYGNRDGAVFKVDPGCKTLCLTTEKIFSAQPSSYFCKLFIADLKFHVCQNGEAIGVSEFEDEIIIVSADGHQSILADNKMLEVDEIINVFKCNDGSVYVLGASDDGYYTLIQIDPRGRITQQKSKVETSWVPCNSYFSNDGVLYIINTEDDDDGETQIYKWIFGNAEPELVDLSCQLDIDCRAILQNGNALLLRNNWSIGYEVFVIKRDGFDKYKLPVAGTVSCVKAGKDGTIYIMSCMPKSQHLYQINIYALIGNGVLKVLKTWEFVRYPNFSSPEYFFSIDLGGT